ncbi:ABC-F family ATP-binding cassette domain-containing protein, partial [Deinococcus sp. 6YEL10]|uniref:ATP-binding cassette domain-containing protein n=1 Tax=Deinococcus sp. 6YEL10 TaxID=2745870 RepID=UPI001E4CCC55
QTSSRASRQARRVLLAALLLAPADVYLLDEPTNHLDAGGAAWLRDWIRASGAAFVLASHDRAFLDEVATGVAELERGTLTVYPGTYSEAMALKATLREAQARDFEAYRRKRAALDEERARRASRARSAGQYNHRRASDRDKLLAKGKAQNAQAVNASVARRLERQIERADATATPKPHEDHRQVRLTLPPVPPGPLEVLTVRDLGVTRGSGVVLSGVTLHVRRGDRVALTGPNGGGKSTLLRALLGELPHAGTVTWGAGLTVSLTGQHGEELLGLGTVGDALLDANPLLTPHQLHEVAAALEVPGGPASALSGLSGGQRTRLSLARLSVTRAQVLLLDEPTNHLDLAYALDVVRYLRCEVAGGLGVVAVLHDLNLAARADRLVLLHAGQVLASGRPADVLTPAHLQGAYGVRVRVVQDSDRLLVIPED